MTTIYFVGTYKPIMCGIADYTSFIAGNSPEGSWGVLSFDIEKYGVKVVNGEVEDRDRVWYGIPGRHGFSAPVNEKGLKQLAARQVFVPGPRQLPPRLRALVVQPCGPRLSPGRIVG